MKNDTAPEKQPGRDWHYDPDKKWWYHKHGFWPFFWKKYLVPSTYAGICERCGQRVPVESARPNADRRGATADRRQKINMEQ